MSQRSDTLHVIVKAILIGALVAILIIAAAKLLDLLILAFGATVIAVLVRGLAHEVERRSPISGGWSLAAALLIIIAVIGAVGWLFGTQIGIQFAQLTEILPAAWASLKEQLATLPGGPEIISSLEQPSANGDLLSRVGGVVQSLAGALADLILLLFGAIFIAADPGLYQRGLVMLVPKKKRPLADQALCESGRALRKWMLGQFASMASIGLLTCLGLWLIGVPSAVALGLVAGVAEIIPWAGPFIAAVPIIIVAFAAGPETALLALAVIVAVQQVEGSLIMPYIQKKAVALPPANFAAAS